MLHHHCGRNKPHLSGTTSDSESEATACGDDTDTELAGIDDDDESPSDGETKLPTFSMVRTLHESVDVVRIASFPPPPVVESAEPTAVDWDTATPPMEDWPSGLRDLFDGNPAGAQTWEEVTSSFTEVSHLSCGKSHLSRCPRDARTTMSARSIARAASCDAAACFARRKAKPAQTKQHSTPSRDPTSCSPFEGR